jgi:hypothetical protein
VSRFEGSAAKAPEPQTPTRKTKKNEKNTDAGMRSA